jgi:hypothetical protein
VFQRGVCDGSGGGIDLRVSDIVVLSAVYIDYECDAYCVFESRIYYVSARCI